MQQNDRNRRQKITDGRLLKKMKIFYQITSNEFGTVLLKKRKIAKAFRWWLRRNGFAYRYIFIIS